MSKWLEIFLASLYTQIKIPHRILGFFEQFIYLLYFSLCQMRQKMVNFILDPIDFIIHLHKILILRAHQSLCKSLAPFYIFSWVDSVQPIIKRSRRAETQLNLRKQQTIFEKSKTWCFLHTWHVQSLRKSLRPIRHQNAYEPQKS